MKGEELARFYNVPVETYYELGRAKVKLRDVLRWSEGSVIKLDRLSGEYIDAVSYTHLTLPTIYSV